MKNVYTIFVRLRIRVTVMTVQRAASPCTPHPLFLLLRVWITTAWSSGYIHYKNVELWQQFALLPTRWSFDFHAEIAWHIRLISLIAQGPGIVGIIPENNDDISFSKNNIWILE